MKPYYEDDSVTLYHGDCLDVLAELDDNSIDSVVTDPPYGLEFMGKDWDSFGRDTEAGYAETPRFTNRGSTNPLDRTSGPNHFRAGAPFQRWCEQWAAECLRVLKPGGHMLAFGGSRTWHRLACAVEDAGFEIRDSIAWLYGSGFPKSLDVSKAIDKAAGAEREVVTEGASGVGTSTVSALGNGLNVNFAPRPITAPATPDAEHWRGWGTALKPAFEPIVVGRKPLTGTVAANVLEHGTGALNVDGCRVEGKVPATTRGANQFGSINDDGWQPSQTGDRIEPHAAGRWPTNVVLDESQAAELDKQTGILHGSGNKGDTGTGVDANYDAAAYHVSYAGRANRDYGSEGGGASRFFPTFRYEAKAPTSERPRDGDTAHPTVKPLDLMQWLVKLATPPGGTVLDPFAGSGTTAEACVIEGFKCIAIEREATYLPLIVARLSKPIQVGLDFDGDAA